jgi:hypothetical protein
MTRSFLCAVIALVPIGCSSGVSSGDGNSSPAPGNSSVEGGVSSNDATASDAAGGPGSLDGTGPGSGTDGSAPHADGATSASDAGALDGGSTFQDFNAMPTDFDCLKHTEWTQVGVSLFKNMLGHTSEMLAAAKSPDGGTFPVGTIIQLVPGEASVKRASGFSAASHDWEFFSLNTSSSGTTIAARGGNASVVNSFGLSCLNCHGQAASQWDLLCGDVDGGNTHGCAALPLTGAQLAGLRSSDPRCP